MYLFYDKGILRILKSSYFRPLLIDLLHIPLVYLYNLYADPFIMGTVSNDYGRGYRPLPGLPHRGCEDRHIEGRGYSHLGGPPLKTTTAQNNNNVSATAQHRPLSLSAAVTLCPKSTENFQPVKGVSYEIET